jgi:hypothetical protein
MRTSILSLVMAVVTVGSIVNAQSPTPVVVMPAMTPATKTQTATTTTTTTAASTTASTQTVLKTLQAMKAANDEILKQQAATLQKLDEIEKAAQEIRIYTKRG